MDDKTYAEKVVDFSSRRVYLEDCLSVVDLDYTFYTTDVLDFGCGTGELLAMIHRLNECNLYGVEPNDYLRAIAMGRGYKVTKSLEDHSRYVSFDIVYMSHVLGHVGTPAKVLASINKKMSYRGRLNIIMPNRYYDLAMAPKNALTGYQSDPTLQHEWTFPQLRRLLEQCGFEVLSHTYTGEYAHWTPKFEWLRSRLIVRARRKSNVSNT